MTNDAGARLVYSSLLLGTCICTPASAVVSQWVTVGEPGNAADAGGFGSVPYGYRIAETEVTNAQYAVFLNAVAASDPKALYFGQMATSQQGGIVRSGSSGSFHYDTIAGREDRPVVFTSFLDGIRFANWLHNGEPSGPQDTATTEDGAYTITEQGLADNSIARNPGAQFFLPSENEWYKAAYFDPGTGLYTRYPTASEFAPSCEPPTAAFNTANCSAFGAPSFSTVVVASYPGSASATGTFDQGGNVWEWNEMRLPHGRRRLRGGAYVSFPSSLESAASIPSGADDHSATIGFRVASVDPLPEPAAVAGGLAALGMLSLLRRFRSTGARRPPPDTACATG